MKFHLVFEQFEYNPLGEQSGPMLPECIEIIRSLFGMIPCRPSIWPSFLAKTQPVGIYYLGEGFIDVPDLIANEAMLTTTSGLDSNMTSSAPIGHDTR